MSTESRADVSRKVRAFYERNSFPGYGDYDDPLELGEKARKGVYAKHLDDQLPLGVRILDAGCGTGQLAIFLSLAHREVVGIDLCFNSLHKAARFKERFDLRNVSFAQMNLFDIGLREETFDFVFSNGVLHHTADAYGAFENLCQLLKPNGYIIIGLYNRYGRFMMDIRRWIFRLTNNRAKWLDFFMRQKSLSEEKKRIWFADQYCNPHEETFAVGTVLDWFRRNSIEYINSIPKITRNDSFTPNDRLFEPHDPGGPLDHLLSQLGWIFTEGREGGFFLTIGKKVRAQS
jgi:SAM-dependent methyltransferase